MQLVSKYPQVYFKFPKYPNNMETFFAANLKYLRGVKGVSQQNVADLLDVGATTISNYERGITQPNFNQLGVLSKFFGETIDNLLFKDLETNKFVEPPVKYTRGVDPVVLLNLSTLEKRIQALEDEVKRIKGG